MTKKDDNRHLKKAMIEALEKSLGVVTTACKIAKIARATHYVWYNKDPEYKEKVDELESVALDFAESKLHQRIKEGSDTSIIFFLKTKGKSRGYIERQEVLQGSLDVVWNETKTYDK